MINAKIKTPLRRVSSVLLTLIIAFGATLLSSYGHASAQGDATFALSPTSGSYTSSVAVQISETSSAGDDVEGVLVQLNYPSFLSASVSINGPFTSVGENCVNASTSSCAANTIELGLAATSTVSGTQNIAKVTFTVNGSGGTTSTSTSSPNYLGLVAGNGNTTGSAIADVSNDTDVWNGVSPAAALTVTPPSTPAPTTPTTTTTTTGSGTTKTTTTTKKSTTSTPTTTTPTTSTTTTPTTSTTTTTSPTSSTTPTLSALSLTVSNSQNKPVQGAVVTLNTGQTSKTNSYGVVSFPGIASGTYTVTIKDPGKKPVTTKVTVGPGQNKAVTYKYSANKSSTGEEIALAVLIVLILLAIGFIFLRRMRSGLQPMSPGSNGIVVGGTSTLTSPTPSGPVNAPGATQSTVVQSSESAQDKPATVTPPIGGNISAEPTSGVQPGAVINPKPN